MNRENKKTLSRRDVLKGGGVLIVGFAIGKVSSAATTAKPNKIELGPYGPPEDQLDSWLEIAADGRVTLFSGCSELGTGSSTALSQIVAEELDVPFERVKLTLPDTNRTPDQFVTSGSRTISLHSRPIRQASAEARAALVDLAAKRLKVSPEQIVTRGGIAMVRGAENKQVTYGELIGGKQFNLKVTGKVKPKSPKDYTIVGTDVKRWDIPGKVFGTFEYLQDVKVPGMLHGRVVRPPSNGSSVVSINEHSVANIPGLVKVVRVADLVGVVCQREEQAIAAAKALEVKWSDWAELPDMKDLHKTIRNLPEFASGYPKNAPGGVLAKKGNVEAGMGQAAKEVKATYYSAFNHHGSIGPSCAVADFRPDGVTVWCGTQTPYGTREAVAKFLGMPNDKVRLIFAEASGCYGQNGADDVVIDALVLSRAVSKPVRVQWSRADENGWESYKAARVSECRAGLDANGKIVAWDAQTWGQSGYSRPGYHEPKHGGEPGSLVTAQLAGWDKPGLEEGFSGAAGNFIPVYDDIPNKHVVFTYLGPASHRDGPLRIRVGSMRGVGSPDNIFVAECFMDELAAAAGIDALDFRLRHLPFERGVSCLKAAAERAKWQTRVSHSQQASGDIARGRGVALVGTNTETGVAGIYEVEVNRKTGVVRVPRVVIAHDCGLVVNPGAVKNQIEGGVIQSISRALKEEVKFDRSRTTTLDWASYPIIKFEEIPDEIDIILLDRPELPPSRVGEPASETVWPGVANAIYDAIGIRLRQLPFTPERVLGELRNS